ncbi:MAG: TatD family hydrolase [Lentisphaeria bacterium]|nr:TatD family hydrolase [Lentisphaeria bacterium]
MKLFDTHFHLDKDCSFEEYLQKCAADLQLAAKDFKSIPEELLMLCAGSDYEDSLRAMAFADFAPEVYFSCGVHPHEAEKHLNDRKDFTVFTRHPKLLAIGEIGLDYFYEYSSPEVQKKVLAEFLELALQTGLPAMLHLRDKNHCRQVYDDALEIVTPFARSGGRFVIHCYAGSAADAVKFLDLGGWFGVGGMYTFNAAHNIREAISVIPTDRLLIETDSPYLAPVPYRGRNNTPGMVALVAQALGSARQMLPEKAAEVFTGNAMKFYHPGDKER